MAIVTKGSGGSIKFSGTGGSLSISSSGGGGGGGGGGSPSLTGLKSWWRADDITVSDGSAITTWPEHQGNGNDLTVTSGLNSPTFVASDAAFNGQPVVSFTSGAGLEKYLPTGFGVGDAAFSAYFVIKFNTIGDTIYPLTWGNEVGGAGDGYHIRFRADNGEGGWWGMQTQTNLGPYGSTAFYRSQPVNYSTNILAGRNASGATWDNSLFEVNSVVQTRMESTVAIPANVSNPVQRISLGGSGNNSYYYRLNGKIAEVLYYDTEQTPADKTTTYNYLASRYGISI